MLKYTLVGPWNIMKNTPIAMAMKHVIIVHQNWMHFRVGTQTRSSSASINSVSPSNPSIAIMCDDFLG